MWIHLLTLGIIDGASESGGPVVDVSETANVNDIILAVLYALNYKGTVDDVLRAYLVDLVGSSSGSVNDLLFRHFEGLGFKGTVNDKVVSYGRSLGYPGTYNEVWRKIWLEGGL